MGIDRSHPRGVGRAEARGFPQLRSRHLGPGGGGAAARPLWTGVVKAMSAAQHAAPLLVADVPVVLWLPNHPLLLPVDEDLLALADRVVVDARAFPDTATALDRLASWIEGRREVVDLAWLRLERWRAL